MRKLQLTDTHIPVFIRENIRDFFTNGQKNATVALDGIMKGNLTEIVIVSDKILFDGDIEQRPPYLPQGLCFSYPYIKETFELSVSDIAIEHICNVLDFPIDYANLLLSEDLHPKGLKLLATNFNELFWLRRKRRYLARFSNQVLKGIFEDTKLHYDLKVLLDSIADNCQSFGAVVSDGFLSENTFGLFIGIPVIYEVYNDHFFMFFSFWGGSFIDNKSFFVRPVLLNCNNKNLFIFSSVMYHRKESFLINNIDNFFEKTIEDISETIGYLQSEHIIESIENDSTNNVCKMITDSMNVSIGARKLSKISWSYTTPKEKQTILDNFNDLNILPSMREKSLWRLVNIVSSMSNNYNDIDRKMIFWKKAGFLLKRYHSKKRRKT